MTNEEKAKKLAEEHENATLFGIESPYHAALGAAIEMAAWKQEQMIEKAVEWLEKMIPSSDLERRIYNCFTEEQKQNFIEDFKKAMEE